jgi:hypothetical protein
MFPRAAIAIAAVLLIGLVVAIKMSFPVRLAEATRAQMAVGAKYMKSLKESDIPPWIERTKDLLSEWTPELNPVGAYGLDGKPVPADLQKLGIIRVDILQDQVRYVWMGGMDHTELEVDRLADGTFRFIAHYNDYKSEIIWPKRPNQALERTAARREHLLSKASTLKAEAELALVSGRSASSR